LRREAAWDTQHNVRSAVAAPAVREAELVLVAHLVVRIVAINCGGVACGARVARLILTPPVDHPRTWAVLLRVDVLPDLAQVATDIAGGSLTLELLGRGALAFQLLFAGFAVTAATTAAFATASH
jgi:L-cystine uptake protein TcyP (sodium:dicarboxylate symporter family)